MSYNVHSCVGMDGKFAPGRIANVLNELDADFIALQEVEERTFRGGPVSRFLADAVGLHLSGRTTHKRTGIDYGNLLLSKNPAERSTAHDFAYPRREPRGAIEADFLLDDNRLRIFATHFGLNMKERRAQTKKLLHLLDDDGPDITVVCGDFNEWLPWSRTHRALSGVFGRSPALHTFPSRFARLPLDRIYACPAGALVDIRTVKTAEAKLASDHLPLVADLELVRRQRP